MYCCWKKENSGITGEKNSKKYCEYWILVKSENDRIFFWEDKIKIELVLKKKEREREREREMGVSGGLFLIILVVDYSLLLFREKNYGNNKMTQYFTKFLSLVVVGPILIFHYFILTYERLKSQLLWKCYDNLLCI